jgi:hypothetical protein
MDKERIYYFFTILAVICSGIINFTFIKWAFSSCSLRAFLRQCLFDYFLSGFGLFFLVIFLIPAFSILLKIFIKNASLSSANKFYNICIVINTVCFLISIFVVLVFWGLATSS